MLRRILVLLAVSGTLAIGALYAWEAREYGRYVELIRGEQDLLDKRWPVVERDLRELKSLGLFGKAGRDRDAASYLNPLVGWVTSGQKKRSPLRMLHSSFDALEPKTIPTKGEAVALTAEEQARLVAMDIGWWSRVHEFDHWSFAAVEPPSELIDDPLSPPIPDIYVLQRIARLRGLRAQVVGDFVDTERDTAQLARLVLSSEHSSGPSVASVIGLAGVEHHPNPNIPPGYWRTMRRALVAGQAYTSMTATPTQRDRFDATARVTVPVARCVAWNQSVYSYSVRIVAERRFGEYYVQLDDLSADEDCRFDLNIAYRMRGRVDPKYLFDRIEPIRVDGKPSPLEAISELPSIKVLTSGFFLRFLPNRARGNSFLFYDRAASE